MQDKYKISKNILFKLINAFHTKLQQILHVMYPGFGQDMTRLKYFHRVIVI